ncbi:MFS general substrate transporter, partial [Lineolata rhizophorae]
PEATYSAFSKAQRLGIIIIVCLIGLASPFASVTYTPAIPTIARDVGVTVSQINLTVTTYLVAQAIAPTIWASIGDIHGRRPLYIATLAVFIGSCVGMSVTDSYAALMVLRAMQAAGSAPNVALGSGVIGDVVHVSRRGGFMGFYMGLGGMGTAFGPILGGLFAEYTGWHGIFVFLTAFFALCWIGYALLVPETLRGIVGDGRVPPPWYGRPPVKLLTPPAAPNAEELRAALPPKKKVDLLGPVKMLKEVDVVCCLLFAGLHFVTWQVSMVAIATILADRYGLSELDIGLAFISNGAGSFVASLVMGKVMNRDYKVQLCKEAAAKAERGEEAPQEVEMIERARIRSLIAPTAGLNASVIAFGWTLQYRVHLAAPIIFHFFIGGLNMALLSTTSTLMVDLFITRASSVTASINLVRCCFAAVGTAVVQPMIDAMDVGWTFTTLSFICMLSCPLMLAEYVYGHRWRRKR